MFTDSGWFTGVTAAGRAAAPTTVTFSEFMAINLDR
jgi:hypothetical protein